MKTPAQLILTHGTTDLQILLCDEQGRRWRAVPDKTIVRRFHEWLLTQEADIIDLPDDLQKREAEATFTDWDGDTFALWLRNEAPEAYPDRSSQGRLQLVLPKISPALTQWLTEHAQPEIAAAAGQSPLALALHNAGVKKSPLDSVLVLSTDRGTEEQEPVATFTFLKPWLVKKGVLADNIQETVFLHLKERLESSDSPINPLIAQRIETAIVGFYKRATLPTLLVASMGGLPQIKPLLAEIAVLLAGKDAHSLFKTEHGVVGLVVHTPIDDVRVRRQCLEQVRRGALLDAWVIASPYHKEKTAQRWTRPLKQAAQLLNGNPVGETTELPALQTIIDHARQNPSLLVAIRVETALQTERWLDAINSTLTFLDAAFRDAIKLWAKDHLAEYIPSTRYMRFKTNPPAILLDAKALPEWYGGGPLTYQANMVGENALKAWDEVLGSGPLRELRQIMHKQEKLASGTRFKLADYRNINTHAVMTQDEIDLSLKRFMGSNLWSQGTDNPASRPKPGKCFIDRSLVSNVIRYLAGPEVSPLALYQNLLNQLEENLIIPSPQKT